MFPVRRKTSADASFVTPCGIFLHALHIGQILVEYNPLFLHALLAHGGMGLVRRRIALEMDVLVEPCGFAVEWNDQHDRHLFGIGHQRRRRQEVAEEIAGGPLCGVRQKRKRLAGKRLGQLLAEQGASN